MSETQHENKTLKGSVNFTNILMELFLRVMTGRKRFTLSTEVKVKVKCTLVQALRLCTGRTAYMGIEV